MTALELLAPARDFTSACAAVDYGADALYIGGSGFGARRAAANSVEDIARVVEYAHPFGVRVYATFNTVIFDHELEHAERMARELVDAGVDALIVQDMSVARMGLPVELHASTQMCNMSVEGVRFLEDIGFSRVVLERALSRAQIHQIAQNTNVEIEAFVHGAICVGHSGRCLLSRSMSSRSGNRGECSQPCRLSYDLCDAQGNKIISQKHLLSVKDLNLSYRIGEMVDAGVTSFKIEGRLKEMGYTKNIVAHYRALLDKAIGEREGYMRSSYGVSKVDFAPNPAKSFSRPAGEYLFDGQAHNLASFDTPKSMGERVGRVVEVSRSGAFRVDSRVVLRAGDGICFITSQGLKGTNINLSNGEWCTPNRAEGIVQGVEIFRNFDKQFSQQVESSRTRRKISVTTNVSITNNSVSVTYSDDTALSSTAFIEIGGEVAKSPQKMSETISTQLAKSGDTIFDVRSVEIDTHGDMPFIPASALSTLRREALSQLHSKCLDRLPKGGRHFVENLSAKYPQQTISAEEAVTNHIATELFAQHGVQDITPSWECAQNLNGARVMESSYCLRNEISECLKRGSKLRDPLYLHHGTHRYRLEFDCSKCQMNIIGEF